MTHFVEANPDGLALIPNVMQPSLRNNIKIEKINQKRVSHSLIMNKKDK